MMLSTALPLLLLAAGPQGDLTTKPRATYAVCLRKFMIESLDRKMEKATFRTALPTKCKDEETAFRNAILTQDKADGYKPADAQKDADDQIADYRDQFQSSYSDYLDTNTRPG